MDEEPLDRLSTLIGSGITRQAEDLAHGRVFAAGWATVELDRAAAELGRALPAPSISFVDTAGSLSLGARCRVAGGVLPKGISVVLLEPVTEGRLAATLARFDEGPAAIWIAVENQAEAVAAIRASGVSVSVAQAGPFGPECLMLDGPIHELHRLLVERPGTIPA